MSKGSRMGSMAFAGVIAAIGLVFFAAIIWTWFSRDDLKPGQVIEAFPSTGDLHPVVVNTPYGSPMIDSGRVDAKGQPIMVACATCHDNRQTNYLTNSGSALNQFHKGLNYQHGELGCVSCHNADDYNTLKRADGRPIEFSDSVQLCAQCHGPKARDYEAGLHGGMQGYWDLTRGGRTRNTCINCHDPHHPAYPEVMPVFPPKLVRGETLPAGHGATSETPSGKEHE